MDFKRILAIIMCVGVCACASAPKAKIGEISADLSVEMEEIVLYPLSMGLLCTDYYQANSRWPDDLSQIKSHFRGLGSEKKEELFYSLMHEYTFLEDSELTAEESLDKLRGWLPEELTIQLDREEEYSEKSLVALMDFLLDRTALDVRVLENGDLQLEGELDLPATNRKPRGKFKFPVEVYKPKSS